MYAFSLLFARVLANQAEYRFRWCRRLLPPERSQLMPASAWSPRFSSPWPGRRQSSHVASPRVDHVTVRRRGEWEAVVDVPLDAQPSMAIGPRELEL